MKKFKLLTSIASLCFAVAVLCFGVFAATTVTYNVSGTITYTVQDFFMDITTRVFYMTDVNSESDLQTKANALKAKPLAEAPADIDTYKYAGVNGTYRNEGAVVDGTVIVKDVSSTGESLVLTSNALNVEFGNTNKAYTYFVVISFKNYASRNLKVNVGSTSFVGNASDTTSNLVSYMAPVAAEGIAQNGTANMVIAMSIKDKKVSIPSAETNKYNVPITFAY